MTESVTRRTALGPAPRAADGCGRTRRNRRPARCLCLRTTETSMVCHTLSRKITETTSLVVLNLPFVPNAPEYRRIPSHHRARHRAR
jgi:hypothetical protein